MQNQVPKLPINKDNEKEVDSDEIMKPHSNRKIY